MPPVPVPFFDPARSAHRYEPAVDKLLDDVFVDHQHVNGSMVGRFEDAMATYTGARHAMAVRSGTDALVLLLAASGVGRGDEVIVPAYTFVATASSVALVGATPVFVDIEPRSYGMDVGQVAAAIGPRTRAIMPVHLFNQMADMPALRTCADDAGLLLLEDSAEGIGMRYRGRHAGLHGDAGVLSFFPSKTLGGTADGGMVLTDDDDLAGRVRVLRNNGLMPGAAPYTWAVPGYNSRLSSIQAAVLLAKLSMLDEEIAKRRQIAEWYDALLGPLAPEVAIPSPSVLVGGPTVYYVYLIEVDRREGLLEHLRAKGVGFEVYYPRPLHRQPCFADIARTWGRCEVAERAAQRAVALPMYPDLTRSDVENVADAITEFVRR
jgi:dTDP-4-amino-4,6-dideoxygalactose transaminase